MMQTMNRNIFNSCNGIVSANCHLCPNRNFCPSYIRTFLQNNYNNMNLPSPIVTEEKIENIEIDRTKDYEEIIKIKDIDIANLQQKVELLQEQNSYFKSTLNDFVNRLLENKNEISITQNKQDTSKNISTENNTQDLKPHNLEDTRFEQTEDDGIVLVPKKGLFGNTKFVEEKSHKK